MAYLTKNLRMRLSRDSSGANPAHKEEEPGGNRHCRREPDRRHRHLNKTEAFTVTHRPVLDYRKGRFQLRKIVWRVVRPCLDLSRP